MAIPTETRSGTYLRGLADVRVRDDSELVIKFDGGDDIYTVPYDMAEVGIIEDGRYRVSLSSDGSKIFGINPESGTYVVRYNGMVSANGQPPTPKLIQGGPRKSKDGRKWTQPDYLAFTVLLRIIGKKMTIPYQLNYTFEQYKDTGETLIPLGGKNLERTADFLKFAGMDYSKDTIPWSENVLPFIDDLLHERNVKFTINMKNGYIDSVFPLAPVLDDED